MATKNQIHVRRCHVCGTVNELINSAVIRCSCCQKALAPFYYFEESELEGIGDNKLEMSLWKQKGAYHPIWGLSTYWEEDASEKSKVG